MPTPDGLTPEELERLKKVARRRFVVALIAGIILAVLGYVAGKNYAISSRGLVPGSWSVSIAADSGWGAA